MKGKIVLFIGALFLWIFWNWPPDYQHFIVGILVAMVVSLFMGDLFVQRGRLFRDISRYIWFLYYIIIFIWECLKANIDVALRVIHPYTPLRPGIVMVKTKLKSDIALTFLANSITLTPGTLSVDIDKERGIIFVHWINVKKEDVKGATEIIVRRFERILEKIFE